jgi:hypothetical protein
VPKIIDLQPGLLRLCNRRMCLRRTTQHENS